VPEVIPAGGYLVKYFFIFGHPIPFIPFPSRGRGGFLLEEGLTPLLNTPLTRQAISYGLYLFTTPF